MKESKIKNFLSFIIKLSVDVEVNPKNLDIIDLIENISKKFIKLLNSKEDTKFKNITDDILNNLKKARENFYIKAEKPLTEFEKKALTETFNTLIDNK